MRWCGYRQEDFFLFFFSVASEIFVQQFFRKFIPRRPFSSTLLPELCETQQHLVVHLIFKNRLQYCCSCRITFIQSHPYLMMMINNEDEHRGWIRLWWSDCHAWIPCNTAVVFRFGGRRKRVGGVIDAICDIGIKKMINWKLNCKHIISDNGNNIIVMRWNQISLISW